MRGSKKFILSAILIFGLSCGILFIFAFPLFQPPRVSSIEPVDDAQEILPTSPITITFSLPMQRDVTQNAIRIFPRVNGQWDWLDNQTLVFTPRETLPFSKTLTIHISQDARSLFQQALASETRARFTTLAYPHVVASSPARGAQFVYIPNQVTVTFNRALNKTALRENLVITPTLANAKIAVDETTVTVTGFFQPRTRYKITIDAGVTDKAYGIALERDFVWSFIVSEQYPNFSILNRGRVLEFSASEKILIPTQFTNVSRLDTAIYPLTRTEFDANARAPFAEWYMFRPMRAPILQKQFFTNARFDKHMQQTIVLDSLALGVYYLEITTPEGLRDQQLLQVQ